MTIPQQQQGTTGISLNNMTSNTTTMVTDDDESAAPATDPRHLLVAYDSRRRSRVHQLNVWLSQFKKVAGERDGVLGSCHAGLASSAIPPLPAVVLESHPDDVFSRARRTWRNGLILPCSTSHSPNKTIPIINGNVCNDNDN